ncbi:hypothetical protein BT69DRAFT_1336748 [Atractiella rhizophila]|nr:hypothetical protein BT69DRAFT_1336748 [Atractiella rhizophila]
METPPGPSTPPRTPTPSRFSIQLSVTSSPSASSTSHAADDNNANGDDRDYARQLRHFRTRSLVSPSPGKVLFSSSADDLESLADGGGGSTSGSMIGGSSSGEEMTIRINESCDSCRELLSTLHSLQEDLHLSASLGQSLLSQRTSLTKEVSTLQTSNAQLLTSLSASLSRASASENQLAELRAEMEGLKVKNGMLEREGQRRDGERKGWEREREDARKELEVERREREKAERAMRRWKERFEEERGRVVDGNEVERREREKAERAMRRWKERFEEERGRVVDGNLNGSAEKNGIESIKIPNIKSTNPEVTSLLSLLSSLRAENDALTTENTHLQNLLSTTRDEHSLLLDEMERDRYAQMEERKRMEEEEIEESMVGEARKTLMSEVLLAPDVGTSMHVGSPTGTDKTTSFAGKPWGVHALSDLQGLRSPARSTFSDDDSAGRSSQSQPRKVEKHTHYHYHSSNKRRPVLPPLANSTSLRRKTHTRGSSSIDLPSPAVAAFPDSGSKPPSRSRSHSRSEHQREDLEDLLEQEELLKEVLSPLPRDGEEEEEQARKGRHRRELSNISMFRIKSQADAHTHPPGQPSGLSIALSRSAPDEREIPALRARPPSPAADGIRVHRATQTDIVRDSTPSLNRGYTSSISERSTGTSENKDPNLTDTFTFNPGPSVYNLAGMGSHPDSRTALLNNLVEHATKLLARLQSADIGSLEKRLKKQNLTGDVRHLAHMTLRDLLVDIENMRPRYRKAIENEQRSLQKEGASSLSESQSDSLVSRKDFTQLVRLLRDLLFEMGRLRVLLNKVELDPSLVPLKVKELDVPLTEVVDIIRPLLPEEPERKHSGPGLLAPFSRFFSSSNFNSPDRTETRSPPLGGGRRMPKLQGSNAVTPATVNVEFGSTGVVRRAVSVNPASLDPVSATTSPSRGPGESGVTAGGKTLKRTVQDVQRLNSIFAGGILRPKAAPQDRWIVLPNADTLPTASTSTAKAVIDGDGHGQGTGQGGPRLLEQTLRSRGLSDSSIHSTFLAHGATQQNSIASRLLTPAGRIESTIEDTVVPAPVLAGMSTSRKQILDQLSAKVRSISGSHVPPSQPQPHSASASSTPPTHPITIPHATEAHEDAHPAGQRSWFPSASFMSPSGREEEWERERKLKALAVENPAHWRKVTGRWEAE